MSGQFCDASQQTQRGARDAFLLTERPRLVQYSASRQSEGVIACTLTNTVSACADQATDLLNIRLFAHAVPSSWHTTKAAGTLDTHEKPPQAIEGADMLQAGW